MANERLKQITTKAKQLYKSGKYKKWTDAIKAASKQLPAAKKSSKKKASVKKIAGWNKGNTRIIETSEKKVPGKKNVRVNRNKSKSLFEKKGTFKKFTPVAGINNDLLGSLKKHMDWLNFHNEQLAWWKNFKTTNTNAKKEKTTSINYYNSMIKAEKQQIAFLKNQIK